MPLGCRPKSEVVFAAEALNYSSMVFLHNLVSQLASGVRLKKGKFKDANKNVT